MTAQNRSWPDRPNADIERRGRKLALFFTRGISLKTWESVGNLDRELAIYRRLAGRGWDVSLVTYGSADEERMLKGDPGFTILSGGEPFSSTLASLLLPIRLRKDLAGATLFKSNQADGAWSAVMSATVPSVKVTWFSLEEIGARRFQEIRSPTLWLFLAMAPLSLTKDPMWQVEQVGAV